MSESIAQPAPGELVFFAGYVALDPDGKMVGGGDFAAQLRQAFANLGLLLAAAGCSPASVLKVTCFVVGVTRERPLAIRTERDAFFTGPRPTATLHGVAALFDPDALIEIEVIAACAR